MGAEQEQAREHAAGEEHGWTIAGRVQIKLFEICKLITVWNVCIPGFAGLIANRGALDKCTSVYRN